MDRTERIAWAKDRAMEYVRQGDHDMAIVSLMSDLTKHPETQDHDCILLGTMLAINGNLSTIPQVRDWIDGIN